MEKKGVRTAALAIFVMLVVGLIPHTATAVPKCFHDCYHECIFDKGGVVACALACLFCKGGRVAVADQACTTECLHPCAQFVDDYAKQESCVEACVDSCKI